MKLFNTKAASVGSSHTAGLTAINFVADAINRTVDLREIAGNALHALTAVTRLEVGAIYLWDDDRGTLQLHSSHGLATALTQQFSQLKRDEPGLVMDVMAGKTCVVDDLLKTDGYEQLQPLANAGYLSAILCPINAQGFVAGLLLLATTEHQQFEEEDVGVIEVICNQLGNALIHAQLEAEARASEAHYRLLVENSDDAIYITGSELRPRYANAAFARVFGCQVNEFAASDQYSRIDPVDVAVVQAAHAGLRTGKAIHGLEYRFCRGDGKWIVLQCDAGVLTHAGNEPSEFQFVVRDVTEAHRRQQELIRSNAQLTALLAISGGDTQTLELEPLLKRVLYQAADLLHADAAYVIRYCGEHAKVVATTPRLSQLLGADFLTTHGLSGQLGGHPQGRIFSQSEIRRYAQSTVLQRLNPHSALLVPLITRDVSLGALGLIRETGSASDFTTTDLELMSAFAGRAAVAIDAVQLLHELSRKNAQLELLIEEAHHRIKNSLQMVSSLLQLESIDNPAIAPAIARIQAIAKVHNLLSREMPDNVNASALITAILDTMKTSAAGRWRVELDLQTVWLTPDQATALSLIVNELAANALKHANPRSGALLCLTVHCRQDAASVLIRISDNGGGFSPGFDWHKSHGQGMSIIRQLTRTNLRGTIEFTNQAGGLCAELKFPSAAVRPAPRA